MIFKKVTYYLDSAVKSNTGVSSLSLIVVAVGIMAVITLIVVCICLLVEVFTSHTIASSLDGYAAIIASIAGLITSVGIPKAINNYSENKFHTQQKVDNLE